jgi:hypothetical protein
MQNQQLFNERIILFFKFTKIPCNKYKGLSLKSVSYLYLTCTAKTYEKRTSFLATDATTQSSDQEENETRNCFLFRRKITQQGKMLTRTKPRE